LFWLRSTFLSTPRVCLSLSTRFWASCLATLFFNLSFLTLAVSPSLASFLFSLNSEMTLAKCFCSALFRVLARSSFCFLACLDRLRNTRKDCSFLAFSKSLSLLKAPCWTDDSCSFRFSRIRLTALDLRLERAGRIRVSRILSTNPLTSLLNRFLSLASALMASIPAFLLALRMDRISTSIR
jgi:hypothetical protein